MPDPQNEAVPHPACDLFELADRRTAAFARARSESKLTDVPGPPGSGEGHSLNLLSVAVSILGVAGLSRLLHLGFLPGFGCVFLAFATAVVPSGVARRTVGCALVSTALTQLTIKLAVPFIWGARFAFFFTLLTSAVYYVSWRFSDIS